MARTLWSTRSPTSQSVSRYLDGRDNNANGRDFGLIPFSPGTTNNQTANANYSIPDVDAVAVGNDVSGFHSSFVLPRVIDPTFVDTNNTNAIPASPHGGNAIVSWDPTGGGNMSASNDLVTKFELSAYIDRSSYGFSGDFLGEQTVYGIGTTGTFSNYGNPSGTLGSNPGGNGNTGVGWLFERQDAWETNLDLAALHLIDFGAGGNGEPGQDWTIITTIDLLSEASGWHDLSIEIDGSGNVTAEYDGQTFNFTTSTDLIGNFYAGYRQGDGAAGTPANGRPATFDLISTGTNIADADGDGDGDVDGADFLKLQRENPAGIADWVAAYPGALSAVSVVLEPNSLLIVVMSVTVTGLKLVVPRMAVCRSILACRARMPLSRTFESL